VGDSAEFFGVANGPDLGYKPHYFGALVTRKR